MKNPRIKCIIPNSQIGVYKVVALSMGLRYTNDKPISSLANAYSFYCDQKAFNQMTRIACKMILDETN